MSSSKGCNWGMPFNPGGGKRITTSLPYRTLIHRQDPIHSLKLTYLKKGRALKRKGSSSIHFQVLLLLVSGRVYTVNSMCELWEGASYESQRSHTQCSKRLTEMSSVVM